MAFRAYLVTKDGDTLRTGVTELDEADLLSGEVLVRIEWSAVNYKDGMVTVSGNRVARTFPLVPGVDLAGTVTASTDPDLPPGTSVLVHGYDLGVARHGGFAELARVPADWVVPLPPGLDARHAMVVGTAGFTAVLSLRQLERAGLEPASGPVLVTGASGGVGSMAVALLAHHGYEVVASTGKMKEHDYLRRLGASEVVGRDGLTADKGRVLGPERWAGAIDCVGGATLAAVLRSLRYGGAVAASGLTGGSGLEMTVYPFIVRGAALLGVDSVATPIAVRRATWATVADELPAGVVGGMVDREVDLYGLTRALGDILDGRVRGRVLVRPDPA
jgi:acrylyl-CoA reductase (NADPH)